MARKYKKMKVNNFTFPITCICHGAPTETVTFLRSAHAVPPCSHEVLGGDGLRGHGELMACSWHAKRRVVTTYRRRAYNAHGAFQCIATPSSQSVYEHLRATNQAYCRYRDHAYERE